MQHGSTEQRPEGRARGPAGLPAAYAQHHRYAVTTHYVSGRRVLDLACGDGSGAALLARTADEVIGVDVDPRTVERARQRHGGRGLGFRSGSPVDPDLFADDRPFDVVVCFDMLHRVDDHETALELIRSWLAPGGLLVTSIPDPAARAATTRAASDDAEIGFNGCELTGAEFDVLLKSSFRHAALLKQHRATGSLLVPSDPGDPDAAVEGVRLQTLRRGANSADWQVHQGVPHTCLLGFASDRPLPKLPATAVLLDPECGIDPVPGGAVCSDGHPTDAAEPNGTEPNTAEPNTAGSNTASAEPVARLRERPAEPAAVERSHAANEEQHEQLRAELLAAQHRADRDAARVEWLRDTIARLEGRIAVAHRRAAELAERNAELERAGPGVVRRAVRAYRGFVRRNRDDDVSARAAEWADEQPARVRSDVPERAPDEVPRSARPRVSVVLPAGDRAADLARCLCAIATYPVSVPFEVLVICTESTPLDCAERHGVRVVRVDDEPGFRRACAVGAEHARGEQLLLLRPDTELTESWLDTMSEVLTSDAEIGAVGAKLVHPDGKVRQSGGIAWANGALQDIGAGTDPRDARCTALREVDHCSPAALLVRADVFAYIGGFDERFATTRYAGADLAFAMRAAGYRTVVQPRVVVVDRADADPDPNTERGAHTRELREVDRSTFAAKWSTELAWAHLPADSVRNRWLARQRGTRGHHGPLVLVAGSVSARTVRLLHQLRLLDCRVVLLPTDPGVSGTGAVRPHDRTLLPDRDLLHDRGVTVLTEEHHRQQFLREAGPELAVALLVGPRTAGELVEQVRFHAPEVLLAHHPDRLRFPQLDCPADARSVPSAAAGTCRELELGLVRACDVTLTATEPERHLLAQLAPTADVRLLPGGHQTPEIDTGSDRPPEGADVVLVGDFELPADTDAARWAVTEIMPLVWRTRPDARLRLLGANPPPDLGRDGPDGVLLGEWPAPAGAAFVATRAMLVPVRYGTAAPDVVWESMAAGVPVVGTPSAAEATGMRAGSDLAVATSAAELAAEVVRVLSDDTAWRGLAEAGRAAVATRCTAEATRRALRGLLRSADVPDLGGARET